MTTRQRLPCGRWAFGFYKHSSFFTTTFTSFLFFSRLLESSSFRAALSIVHPPYTFQPFFQLDFKHQADMGKLIWHEYSRLVAITASVCECIPYHAELFFYPVNRLYSRGILIDTFWAGFWGLIWRKFFWDFVGGTMRDPGGMQ